MAWNSGRPAAGLVVQWSQAARPGGWGAEAGRGVVMAADLAADQTEPAKFGILGPLAVWKDGRELPLGGAKQRALLGVLLLRANEVVPTAKLVLLLDKSRLSEGLAHEFCFRRTSEQGINRG